MHIQLIVSHSFHAFGQEQDVAGDEGIAAGVYFHEIDVAQQAPNQSGQTGAVPGVPQKKIEEQGQSGHRPQVEDKENGLGPEGGQGSEQGALLQSQRNPAGQECAGGQSQGGTGGRHGVKTAFFHTWTFFIKNCSGGLIPEPARRRE